MREMCHLWSSKIYELALQIHVLQRYAQYTRFLYLMFNINRATKTFCWHCRVIAKKEDPNTRKRCVREYVEMHCFIYWVYQQVYSCLIVPNLVQLYYRFTDVLKATSSRHPSSGSSSSNSSTGAGLAELASGDLMELFYIRLVVSLQEVVSESVRKNPTAASRLYPSLRKAAVDTIAELKVWFF